MQEEEGRLPWQLTGEADIKPGTLECSASTGVDKSQVVFIIIIIYKKS